LEFRYYKKDRKRRIGEKAAIVSILLILEAGKRQAVPTPAPNH